MALSTTTRNPSTFGRRGDAGTRRTPARAPTVSAPPARRRAEAIEGAATAVATDAVTAASRGKAYAKAILAGATTFIAVIFLFGGVDNRFIQSGPMLIVLAIPILPTLAVLLYIPTVVLSDIARLLSVPRGWADIGIGLAHGLGLGVGIALTSPDERSVLTALAMTAAGAMGGFAFWRAQGYPGTSGGVAATLDQAYDKLT